jgi:hypothetical protein
MNRHPDGRPLSDQDLIDLAVADGADANALNNLRGSLHCAPLFRTHLDRITARSRFSLFCAGFLSLDSRPVPVPDRSHLPAVDAEMFAFLTRKVAVPC